ncbi:substrate-binding domain-containing protein [Komarekiella delphini-convector]|uniref:substrate-binding domain-containing protein n=1 Tax=Komarekiella delphini-convector TaxID=3050158 RepID=UPI003D6865A3
MSFLNIQKFNHIVKSHQDVFQVLVSEVADVSISTTSVSITFGLEFIPLHQSQSD